MPYSSLLSISASIPTVSFGLGCDILTLVGLIVLRTQGVGEIDAIVLAHLHFRPDLSLPTSTVQLTQRVCLCLIKPFVAGVLVIDVSMFRDTLRPNLDVMYFTPIHMNIGPEYSHCSAETVNEDMRRVLIRLAPMLAQLVRKYSAREVLVRVSTVLVPKSSKD